VIFLYIGTITVNSHFLCLKIIDYDKFRIEKLNRLKSNMEVFIIISKLAYSSFWNINAVGFLVTLLVTYFVHDVILNNWNLSLVLEFVIFAVVFFVVHTIYFLVTKPFTKDKE